jgi:uncharacterized membrane protein
MRNELILVVLGAVIVVCSWRAALAILLCTMVGVLLLGLVTAIGFAPR